MQSVVHKPHNKSGNDNIFKSFTNRQLIQKNVFGNGVKQNSISWNFIQRRFITRKVSPLKSNWRALETLKTILQELLQLVKKTKWWNGMMKMRQRSRRPRRRDDDVAVRLVLSHRRLFPVDPLWKHTRSVKENDSNDRVAVIDSSVMYYPAASRKPERRFCAWL